MVRDEINSAHRSMVATLADNLYAYVESDATNESPQSPTIQVNQDKRPLATNKQRRSKKTETIAAQPSKMSLIKNKTAQKNNTPQAVQLNLAKKPTDPASSRFLQAQASGSPAPTFPLFEFGDKTHTYVAGSTGLWQAKVQAASTAAKQAAATTTETPAEEASTNGATQKTTLTQLGSGNPDTVTVNGAATTPSPLAGNIGLLTIYGTNNYPAVVPITTKEDAPASTTPNDGQQIYAATEDTYTIFATNDIAEATGTLLDASKIAINQPIAGLTASRQNNRFFAAVGDGSVTTRAIYPRPADWDTDTVRTALGDVVDTTLAPATITNPEAATLTALTPDATPASPTTPTENYIQAMTNSIGNTVFLNGIDSTKVVNDGDYTKNAPYQYATTAFLDAINVRKGGLIDLGIASAGAGGGVIKPADVLLAIQNTAAAPVVNAVAPVVIGGVKEPSAGILNEMSLAPGAAVLAAPPTQLDADTKAAATLADAILTGLGWGINQLALKANAGTAAPAAGAVKPFVSLDSTPLPTDSTTAATTPTAGMSYYVIDQDGVNRGITVADLDPGTNTIKQNPALTTGNIITTAMYEGIDITQKNLLGIPTASSFVPPAFGKLNEIGIPCAAYSAADSNPATQAIISGNINMVYDDTLGCVFAGFDDIHLGNNAGSLTNGSGAVCSIMVGQPQTGVGAKPNLYFQPIIGNFQPLLFQSLLNPNDAVKAKQMPVDTTNYITGFYQLQDQNKNFNDDASPQDDLHASAKNLAVMHTSTGKDYLIFNGGVARLSNLSTLGSKVYALPLVGPTDAKVPMTTGQLAARRATITNGLISSDGAASIDQKLLKSIDFTVPTGYWDNNAANNLNALLKTQSDLVTKTIQAVVGGGGGNPNLKTAAEALQKAPDFITGLAHTALQAGYTSDTVANASTAATNAIKGNYVLIGPYTNIPTQESGILKNAEQNILTQASITVDQQAPADQVSPKIANIGAVAAAAGTKKPFDAANSITDGYAKIVTITNDKTAQSGALQCIEGSLGVAIANLYKPANLTTTQLLPAVNTMHVDAPTYPAFDYVRVGSNPQLLSNNTSAQVQDIWIQGDTVYASLAATRDTQHNGESGVYASTALFDATGFVRSWSPWQRVQGHTDPVVGVALDPTTSRFWTTTQSGNTGGSTITPDTVRVTAWGTGNVTASNNSNDTQPATGTLLSSVLGSLFGDTGGIFGFQPFGPDTVGFKPRNLTDTKAVNRHEQFSMAVATGNGSVALIQTGAFDTNVFQPTLAYSTTPITSGSSTTPPNVYLFSEANSILNNNTAGTALSNLGIITCAEVSRLPLQAAPNDKLGWLFVGGTDGLAVLTRPSSGMGWNTSTAQGLSGLLPAASRDNFPAGGNWGFIQILTSAGTPFTNVRKLVSDGSKYLYVMTATGIWRIDMTALPGGAARTSRSYSIFQQDAGTTTPQATLTVGPIVHQVVGNANGQLTDMMIFGRDTTANTTQLIVGTAAGLFSTAAFADGDVGIQALVATAATQTIDSGANYVNVPIGPVMRLAFTSSQQGGTLKPATAAKQPSYADGNLYVTALDGGESSLQTYRFNLSAPDWSNPVPTITPFQEPYYETGNNKITTPYFYKVGTLNTAKTLQFNGPLDYFLQSSHVTGSATGFADSVALVPQLADYERSAFTNQFEEIDLGVDLTLPLYMATTQIEPASGAQIVSGEFGIRVND